MIRTLTLYFLCLIFLNSSTLWAQNIPNEIIVSGNLNLIENIIKKRPYYRNYVGDIGITELSKSQSIYLLKGEKEKDLVELKNSLTQQGLTAKYNQSITYRSVPNDDRLEEQWALDNIGIFDAWDETTGDADYGGQKPVVAVMDNGFYTDHEDLEENIFVNTAEIPDNGIDDDLNGYVDDYMGINTITLNDSHPLENHGTAVSGIIGAKSNNGKGISGVLWNAKILLISGIESEAEVIIAYDYMYKMRKAYDDSNGSRGAYITVNNFSGGLDQEWARDHEEWCRQYDRLGQLGILSISAATNAYEDIDGQGDMPSTCESPYLIIVHEINQLNQREVSGNSRTHVDLAAPGTDIISLTKESGYTTMSGTSFAAPYVAGAAQLLYTAPCPEFYNLLQSNPSQAALTVKEALLSGSTKLPALKEDNRSEGSLNIFLALTRLSNLCSIKKEPLNIVKTFLNNQELSISYTSDLIEDHTVRLLDNLGRVVYSSTFKPKLFSEREIRIEIASIPTGLYYVSLMSVGNMISRAVYIP